MDSTIRFVQVRIGERWMRDSARCQVSGAGDDLVGADDDEDVEVGHVFVQDAVLPDMPVFDPVAAGVGAEQDNHQDGGTLVQNDLLDALELVTLVFRQMGQRLLHSQALSAARRRRQKEKGWFPPEATKPRSSECISVPVFFVSLCLCESISLFRSHLSDLRPSAFICGSVVSVFSVISVISVVEDQLAVRSSPWEIYANREIAALRSQ